MKRPLHLAHDLLEEVITKEDIVVDATMGNGNDTLFLAQRAKMVYAFDIQEQAIEVTQAKVEAAHLTNVHLILSGHENLDLYVNHMKAAIFNLGYLPKADKSVITRPKTTLLAIQKCLDRLEEGGRVAIMIYYGHKGGQEEKESVLTFVSSLPQDEYTVMSYRPLNQIHTPPFLVLIEKRKEGN